jgi:hypothetical protein
MGNRACSPLFIRCYCWSDFILGYGYLQIMRGRVNAFLQFGQSRSHFPYFNSVFGLLLHYVKACLKFGTSLRKGTVCHFVRFHPRCLPFLTELHTLFYVKPACETNYRNKPWGLIAAVAPLHPQLRWVMPPAALGLIIRRARATPSVCRGSPIDNSPGRLTHPRTGGRRGAVPIENPAGLAGGPGVKVIPDSVIMYNLLTPIAFAHWIIGEGTWKGVWPRPRLNACALPPTPFFLGVGGEASPLY